MSASIGCSNRWRCGLSCAWRRRRRQARQQRSSKVRGTHSRRSMTMFMNWVCIRVRRPWGHQFPLTMVNTHTFKPVRVPSTTGSAGRQRVARARRRCNADQAGDLGMLVALDARVGSSKNQRSRNVKSVPLSATHSSKKESRTSMHVTSCRFPWLSHFAVTSCRFPWLSRRWLRRRRCASHRGSDGPAW